MPPRATRVVVVDRTEPEAAAIADAAACLAGGGLVVFPTETVYGLGANALDADAVAGIFEAKGRPSTDPLIVHLHDAGELPRVARHVPPIAEALAARFWPGALTLILPKRPAVPPAVTAGLDSVAVRVPSHPVARALLAAARVPVAAPSANRFSRPSPTQVSHVLADLDGRVDLVLDAGPTDIGLESTVLDLSVTPPVVRRPGGVSVEALRAMVPDLVVLTRLTTSDEAQVAPGQLLRHYAPRATVTLIVGPAADACARVVTEATTRVSGGKTVGLLVPAEDLDRLQAGDLARVTGGRVIARAYGSRRDPDLAARALFDALRGLDAAGVDEILALAPDPEGIGLAIHDRLTRAAEGRVVHAGGTSRA